MTLNEVLDLFGTESARDNFRRLCGQYYSERARGEAIEAAGETLSNSRRREIHDAIMRIVQKLFLHSSEVMPSRKEVGNMIMQFFRREEL